MLKALDDPDLDRCRLVDETDANVNIGTSQSTINLEIKSPIQNPPTMASGPTLSKSVSATTLGSLKQSQNRKQPQGGQITKKSLLKDMRKAENIY